jgi:perosamine synthetase
VFCDIDPLTFNIDANQVESLISSSTRAIIAVNLFGLAADLPRLAQIACKHGLYLVEDAACSLGATVDGRQSGTFGRIGCFSFHPRKSITTGEGGMIVGNCEEDENSLRSLRSHGFRTTSKPGSPSVPYDLGEFDRVGYNYRMTDLQAAVGIAQVKKLDGIIARRREIAATYHRELKGIQLFRLPVEPARYFHTYQSYVVMVECDGDSIDSRAQAMKQRNKIMLKLQSDGIATRPGTHAVHTLSYYRQRYDLTAATCPCATDAMNLSIALPLYPSMTEGEIEYVITRCHSAVTEVGSGSSVAVH